MSRLVFPNSFVNYFVGKPIVIAYRADWEWRIATGSFSNKVVRYRQDLTSSREMCY